MDSTVEAYASDDKMQAFITATQPEGGGAADFEMIIRALHDKGIVACINEGRIGNGENPYGVPVLVAEGIPAENGKMVRSATWLIFIKTVNPSSWKMERSTTKI